MRQFEDEAHIQGYYHVAGIDEAGRGPIAGPLVVGCVVFPVGYDHPMIDDSKKLSEKKRLALYDIIIQDALSYAVLIKDVAFIDTHNIYQATKKMNEKIITMLNVTVDFVLTDAMPLTDTIKHRAIIKGDQQSISIAAASILAKVTRDQIMKDYALQYPQYGFEKHKGYPTPHHKAMLRQHGVTKIHRRSFEPVKSMCKGEIQ